MYDGWIAVDLDGTLAEYEGWQGIEHIGAPIPLMVERVKRWLGEGRTVKIFTARYSEPGSKAAVRLAVHDWTLKHIGVHLEVTCTKDFAMDELWDDRAVTVEANTGAQLAPSRRGLGDAD